MRVIQLTIILFCSTAFTQQFNKIVGRESGIDFNNTITETEKINVITYPYLYNGGGVAIGDINNDGLEDIYFTGNQVDDKLYLNQGNLKFKDVTDKYFKDQKFGFHTGVTMVDINNDGWLDICVSAAGPSLNPEDRRNKLFINQEGKEFINQAKEYGLDDTLNTTQTVFFDADGDGDLDAYVLNHGFSTYTIVENSSFVSEKYISGKDRLMINNGAKFHDESDKMGISSEGFGMGISISDLNNDFIPDIYITNDFDYPDMYYSGTQYKRFRLMAGNYLRSISLNAFGLDIADFNNDGWMDILSVDFANGDSLRTNEGLGNLDAKYYQNVASKMSIDQFTSNSLQLNLNGKFINIAHLANIAITDWGWAAFFADFNNDGFQDIYIATGCPKDIRNRKLRNLFNNDFLDSNDKMTIEAALNSIPELSLRNYLFLNNKNLSFKDDPERCGFLEKVNVNGAAYADLDNDGDLDIICNALDNEAFIMQNNLIHQTHYLKIKFLGPEVNRSAVGAKVVIYLDESVLSREAYSSRGYLSSMSPIMHFGLNSGSTIDSLVIFWNRTEKTTLKEVQPDQTLIIDYNVEPKVNIEVDSSENVGFERVKLSGMRNMVHSESLIDSKSDVYNSFERLSRLGPFVEISDFNGDGRDDLFLGGTKGHSSKLFIQNESKGFDLDISNVWSTTMEYEDMDAAFLDFDKDGDLDLYVVSGGNESENQSAYQDRLYINNGANKWELSADLIPLFNASGQKVIAEDINNDGWDDIIVFGRQIPGKYPSKPNSTILVNQKGKFQDKTAEMAPKFDNLGMVTDAVCLDIDHDDDKDFIIVGEWMPVTIFKNENGIFQDVTKSYGLHHTRGWWNSINLYEEKNMSMSFIVGNLGKNTPYKTSTETPYRLNQPNFLDAKNEYVAHTFANSFLTIYNQTATLSELPNIFQAGQINTVIKHDFSGNGIDEIILAGNNFQLKNHQFQSDGNPGWMVVDSKFDQVAEIGMNLNIRSGGMIFINESPYIVFGINNSKLAFYAYDETGKNE